MTDSADPRPQSLTGPNHHLMIAGTGRSGTSLLVRFLAAMGLDTHLAKSGEQQWSDEANAGLEDIPITAAFDDLPYVIKTPFLSEIIDAVLRDPAIVIDAVIIPVRDLTQAAASRTVLELQTIHRFQPWMLNLEHTVETWGTTPGGVVYSLNPVDQGRLLAVGFHRLIERLTRADVPMLFLDFPRLATDSDYLFGKLRALLPAGSTPGQAQVVHATLADPTKIRVGKELGSVAPGKEVGIHAGPVYPDGDTLNLIALRRELSQQRAQAAKPQDEHHLGQRETAIGEREMNMAKREQRVLEREAELMRQLAEIARSQED
jgi:hypothetical protein